MTAPRSDYSSLDCSFFLRQSDGDAGKRERGTHLKHHVAISAGSHKSFRVQHPPLIHAGRHRNRSNIVFPHRPNRSSAGPLQQARYFPEGPHIRKFCSMMVLIQFDPVSRHLEMGGGEYRCLPFDGISARWRCIEKGKGEPAVKRYKKQTIVHHSSNSLNNSSFMRSTFVPTGISAIANPLSLILHKPFATIDYQPANLIDMAPHNSAALASGNHRFSEAAEEHSHNARILSKSDLMAGTCNAMSHSIHDPPSPPPFPPNPPPSPARRPSA
jgi:hypothetical protein